jgi:hypothetical protein
VCVDTYVTVQNNSDGYSTDYNLICVKLQPWTAPGSSFRGIMQYETDRLVPKHNEVTRRRTLRSVVRILVIKTARNFPMSSNNNSNNDLLQDNYKRN